MLIAALKLKSVPIAIGTSKADSSTEAGPYKCTIEALPFF
ncbi:hypothetical protein NIASO_10005 [Niabella soli DSM 19437]|uniref:Uncharacterized protein n=1 Tax=Niabella soli DSM 19437 TaxID=929713 RepID=W0F864_9BACT|nr:hypothetical protein NIASO_10005 [Niabella soli DSM 19437]